MTRGWVALSLAIEFRTCPRSSKLASKAIEKRSLSFRSKPVKSPLYLITAHPNHILALSISITQNKSIIDTNTSRSALRRQTWDLWSHGIKIILIQFRNNLFCDTWSNNFILIKHETLILKWNPKIIILNHRTKWWLVWLKKKIISRLIILKLISYLKIVILSAMWDKTNNIISKWIIL